MAEGMLSPREVAEMVGLSRSFVYREIERGNLRAFKMGGRLRIDPNDLTAWLNSARIEPPRPAYEPAPRPRKRKPDSSFLAELREARSRREE